MLTRPPPQAIAGDTWSWQTEVSDRPAPTWTAIWHFERAGAAFNVSGTAVGTQHAGAAAAVTTATIAPGVYQWSLRLRSGGEAHVVDRGEMRVLPDPAVAGTFDNRSTAEKVVAALESLALTRSSAGQTSIAIDGVSMTFETQADIIRALSFWRQELARERRAAGLTPGASRTIRARFGRLS